MKRTILIIAITFAFFFGTNIYSQNRIIKPFMIDSVNNKGEKFDMSIFLQIPSAKHLEQGNFLKAKPNELITLSAPKDNEVSMTTYIYRISSFYLELTLNVFATDIVKIGLNGNSIKERLFTKDSLNEDSKVSCKINLDAGMNTISFSFLCSDENPVHQFKFSFEEDSLIAKSSDAMPINYGLTLNQMLLGRNIYSSSISPSGDFILVKYFDMDSDGKRNYGYSIGDRDKILFSEEGNTSIEWLEEGISFKKEDNELYYIDTKNTNKKLVTLNTKGVKTIIMDNLPDGDITLLPNRDYCILSITSKIDNSKDDLRQYLLPDDRIEGWRNRTLLSLYDFKTKQIQPLTYGYHSTYLNDYNPKTNSIIFSCSFDNITKRPFSETSIFEMNLDSFVVDTLVNRDGFISYAKYIPNSDYILLKGSGEALNGVGNTLKKGVIPNSYHSLFFIMNKKTKEIECITKNFNPSVNKIKISDNGFIFFNAENKDSVSLYSYNVNMKEEGIKHIECPLDIVSDFDISKDASTLALLGQKYNDFTNVFIKDNLGLRALKGLERKDKSNLALGDMKEWSFDYKGTKIDCRYYLPYNFNPQTKYPMIVYYYGGTSPTDRSFEMRYSAYLYTAQGYIYLVINPSGTTGWGQEFASRHVNAWGERTADEIIYGVKKFSKDYSFVDTKHIGCMGASYGGFMTQLLQTKTDIFACAISHAGISDISSYWGEGYWGYSYSSGATANSYPWNRKDIYVERSPLFNADKIKTPLLLLHGDSDTNVPIGESIQMYNALKILGKDVEFISVKGENHGIIDYKKRLKWNNTIYAWFAKYLKDNASWWQALYPKTEL